MISLIVYFPIFGNLNTKGLFPETAFANCDMFFLLMIMPCIISLHWLRAQERVRFKTAVLMYKATHGTAPSYLNQLVRVADLPGRRSLRSARTSRLLVPSVKLSTVGGRAFPVAGPTIWNSLPDNVISAPSLSIFRRRLKTFSVPGLVP